MQSRLKVKTDELLPRSITALLILAVGAASVFILSWQFPRGIANNLAVDEPAPNDVTAPSELTYTSEILTGRAADEAANLVPRVYEWQGTRVRNLQIERTSEVLNFISLILADGYADVDVRTEYLRAITEPELPTETIAQILDATPEEWTQIAIGVPPLVGTLMESEIHDDDGSISQAKREVDDLFAERESSLVNTITASLVRSLIRPNSFYNEQRTANLKQDARNGVAPVIQRLKKGESIIRRGEIVYAEDIEALEQFGLARDEWSWWTVLQAFLFIAGLLALIGLAFQHFLPKQRLQNHEVAFLALIALIWLFAAKLMVTPAANNSWLPYLYPLAALSMLITLMIDLRVSVVFTVAFGLIILYISNTSSEFATYFIVGSLVGAFTIGRTDRLTSFLWSSLALIFTNILVYLTFNLPLATPLESTQFYILLALISNGILAASLALLGYFVIGNLFGFTTSLQLTDLSRPTHPLQRQLLLKAPGTYHHTIVVSNLAERAAAAIGADALLTRVGAYYHDIGKTVRPYFFVENSADGTENPHEKLDPATSAQIIISHVTDGLDLAQKYKLPARVQDFIREHHGTSVVHYFYQQALEAAGPDKEIDDTPFRYAGPKPQTRETALLSLADLCESAIRAIKPKTRTELADIVDRLIDERVDAGELNESDLTFKELHMIKDIFVQVLQGVHHPRITYPAKEEETMVPLRTADEHDTDSLAAPNKPKPALPVAERIPIMDPADIDDGDLADESEEPASEVVPAGTGPVGTGPASAVSAGVAQTEVVPGGVEQPA